VAVVVRAANVSVRNADTEYLINRECRAAASTAPNVEHQWFVLSRCGGLSNARA